MKLSERIRDGNSQPTPAGDCWYLWLDQLEELEKLETQFQAELNAAKKDFEHIVQLEESLEACSQEILRLEKKERELEAENEWMRREVERVGHALYTGTKTGYVGTEEDLHAIGQTVEGVCETNLRLMNVEAYCDKLENEVIRLEDENDALSQLMNGINDELLVYEKENERLRFAAKQALMALEEGYDAPKIRQDLRDALKEDE